MESQLKNDIFQWDVANWSQSLTLWEKYGDEIKGKRCLALGERDGGLSLWLALKGSDVVASDLNGVTEQAKSLHTKYNVQNNIEYRAIDMLDIQYPDNTFDMVVFKSVLGALSTKQNQQKAIDEIYRVLKPGGLLLFAENAKGSFLHVFLRKYFTNWSTYWRYLSSSEDVALFSSFSNLEMDCYGFWGLFGRSEKQKNLLSVLDRFSNRMIPKKNRYILFGVAKK